MCVHIFLTVTPTGEWETSVSPQFTVLLFVPVSILCFIKTTYSELVNSSWTALETISVISSTITDYWTMSDAIQWHESKPEAEFVTSLQFLMREIWKPEHFPPKIILWLNKQALLRLLYSPRSACEWIQEASDRYNTCMWLSWLKVEGGRRRGWEAWRQFRGGDYICGSADNASFTAWQPCLHGTTKPKVNKMWRLNQIRQAIFCVYRLTYVSEGAKQNGEASLDGGEPRSDGSWADLMSGNGKNLQPAFHNFSESGCRCRDTCTIADMRLARSLSKMILVRSMTVWSVNIPQFHQQKQGYSGFCVTVQMQQLDSDMLWNIVCRKG